MEMMSQALGSSQSIDSGSRNERELITQQGCQWQASLSPLLEMGAYEALWARKDTTFRKLALEFAKHPMCTPSDFVPEPLAMECAEFVRHRFAAARISRFGVRINGGAEYPSKLRDAQYPVELLYYWGWWALVWTRSVAVVGTRKPSAKGEARTKKLVAALVDDDFTVVSGLASGIDTVAHQTAIANKGRTIAVIGTPLCVSYPRQNTELQRRIATEYLVISQVPTKRYEKQDFRKNRLFFPERNITMSALTEATIIVEAGETSGTLTQARAAISQGRKLFILESCFGKGSKWPERLEEKGGIRVKNYDVVREHLSQKVNQD